MNRCLEADDIPPLFFCNRVTRITQGTVSALQEISDSFTVLPGLQRLVGVLVEKGRLVLLLLLLLLIRLCGDGPTE